MKERSARLGSETPQKDRDGVPLIVAGTAIAVLGIKVAAVVAGYQQGSNECRSTPGHLSGVLCPPDISLGILVFVLASLVGFGLVVRGIVKGYRSWGPDDHSFGVALITGGSLTVIIGLAARLFISSSYGCGYRSGFLPLIACTDQSLRFAVGLCWSLLGATLIGVGLLRFEGDLLSSWSKRVLKWKKNLYVEDDQET